MSKEIDDLKQEVCCTQEKYIKALSRSEMITLERNNLKILNKKYFEEIQNSVKGMCEFKEILKEKHQKEKEKLKTLHEFNLKNLQFVLFEKISKKVQEIKIFRNI